MEVKALWAKFREFLDKLLQGNAEEGEQGLYLGFVLTDRTHRWESGWKTGFLGFK